MQKILIMGGTGAMGKFLVPMVAARGSCQVFVTSRSTRQSSTENVVYLKGDAKDIYWVETILETFDFDTVFDFMMYKGEEFLNRCSFLLSSCKHYFYISSSRVYADQDLLTEASPTKLETLSSQPEYNIDRYGIRKCIEEEALRALGNNNYTIIRPSMTFSQNRIQFLAGDNFDVLRASKGVPTLVPENAIDVVTNLTYGKNVAKMLVGLLDNPKAMGQTFNAVTKSMTWGDIAKAFRIVFGLTYKVISDAEYLELIDLQDGRVLDRLRRRNICNDKILSATELSEDDFDSLEVTLKEAWANSNKELYKSSRASLRAMARFDQLSDSQISLDSFDDQTRNVYTHSKKAYTEKVALGNFLILPNPAYWEISQSIKKEGEIVIKRNNSPVTSHAWLNFRNFNLFRGFEKNATYKFEAIVQSDNSFELKFFLHFYNHSIQRIETQNIQPGVNNLYIIFYPEVVFYSDIAITATELKKNTVFTISEMNICKLDAVDSEVDPGIRASS